MSSIALSDNRAASSDWAINAIGTSRTELSSTHRVCALEARVYSWARELQEQVTSFGWLRPDWDHEGAASVNLATIERARWLLLQLDRSGLPQPTVTPTQAGGVAIEWSTADLDLEIELRDTDSMDLYYYNKVTNDEWEGVIPSCIGAR